jgi:hypothetical protein
MVKSAVAAGASGGVAIGQKVKVSLERAGVPEATTKMKKSGALRTALHRKNVEVIGWPRRYPPPVLRSRNYFLRLQLRLFRKLRLHSGSGDTCYQIFYDKGKWYQ